MGHDAGGTEETRAEVTCAKQARRRVTLDLALHEAATAKGNKLLMGKEFIISPKEDLSLNSRGPALLLLYIRIANSSYHTDQKFKRLPLSLPELRHMTVLRNATSNVG